jgi:hypothetical protein
MTPAERALLVAIGEVLGKIRQDMHLRQMVSAVKAEDDKRARDARMPEMSREAYNDRITQSALS